MNTQETHPEETRKFTGKHMLAIMVAFFGTIIAVNFTMATMASGTWTGLVVKNSYVASQKFNTELKEAKAQRATGLHSDLSYANGKLSFVLKSRNGETLAIENLVAEIGRPAFEQADRKLPIPPASETKRELPINLEPGYWSIKITGLHGSASYRRDARIFVDANGNGRVE